MRRVAATASLAAFAAATAMGYTYKDFYRVDEWEYPRLAGTLYYADERGKVLQVGYDLIPDADGSYRSDLSDAGGQDAYSAFWTAVRASLDAAAAMAQARLAQAQTDAFAERLANLLAADGFEVTDSAGVTKRMRISAGSIGAALGASSGSSAPIPATMDTEFGGSPDGVSIGKTADGRMELYGWSGATASRDEWWLAYNFFVPCLAEGGSALEWKRYGGWHPATFGTAQYDGRTALTLAGWTDERTCDTDLKSILTAEDGDDRANHYVLTRYGVGDDAVFHYVPFGGRLECAIADGLSIVSNSAGAFEVKGASDVAGLNPRRYFGTGAATAAPLGWHELPKTVHGDGATVSTDASVPVEGVADPATAGAKGVGLRGWNYSYAGAAPLFLANVGGSLSYLPMDGGTNAPSCACSNRWEDALAWIGDGEDDGAGGLSFAEDSLSAWLKSLGFVYASPAGGGAEFGFDLDADGGVSAPFGAPANWADGASVEATAGGAFALKGFAAAAPCSASVSAMLGDPSGADASTHLLLAKKTDTGALHYVPIGGGVPGGAPLPVDGASVTTNSADGAASQGVLSLRGWSGAAEGSAPVKRNGSLAWEPSGGAEVDGASVTTNSADGAAADGVVSLFGFADAPVGAVPIVTAADGVRRLRWGTAGNFGVTATKSGGTWSYYVSQGYATVARSQMLAGPLSVSSTGYVYLRVSHSSAAGIAATLVHETAMKSNDSSTTYVLLYRLDVDGVITDWRGAPQIQVWE